MAPSIHLSSLSCLLLSSLYAPTAAFKYERAQSVPQILGRQDFLGGWVDGIPGTTCPSDVPVQCTGIISNPACCPKGTFCLGLGEQYCCPTKTDCKTTVINFPKCAVASHTLYVLTQTTYFCCPPGQFGVLPISSNGGFCLPDGEDVAASRIAEKAADAKTTVEATTRTTKTITSLSTAENGEITTIIDVTTPRVTITRTDNILPADNTNVPSGDDENESSSSSRSGSSPTNSSAPPSSGSSLGAGPIAGIVIGALGVIALFLLAFLLYRRRQPHGDAAAAGQGPAPDYSAYGAPPPANQQDMANYPKSPTASQAGVSTAVGSPSPQYGTYGGPPPPAAGYSEVQGQNTWDGPGRAEIGSGR